ncbi:HAD-IA family hydrolase [Promicromonospora kroppenstedtii]|uniref:HAD-IA family hydrolase n=1 Tax=Promicromonospora kroppenstedtii TaxID=440482 RepID=UPI0006885719|nr:HAD-IA family hydrolase [Promicromonospora kroppenstedtii]
MNLVLHACAVLFDSDGVLVDSKAAGEAAWHSWALRHRLDPSHVLAGVHGRRSRETVARFLHAAEVGPATAEIDALEIRTSDRTVAIKGATQLMASIPGTSRAVVTSASRDLATARLAAAGILLPAVLVSAEDVAAGKPAPDPYLRAAERLRIPPADCVVLEDSAHGIRSARAAGVGAVLGVGDSARGLGCEAVVPDLTSVRWTENGIVLTEAYDTTPAVGERRA